MVMLEKKTNFYQSVLKLLINFKCNRGLLILPEQVSEYLCDGEITQSSEASRPY